MLYRFRWKLGWSRHVRVGDEACPHCGELVAARSRVRRRLGAVLVVHRSDVDRAHGREATEPGNVVIDLRGGLDAGRRRRWTRASTRTSIATSIAIGCACLTALRRRAVAWCERGGPSLSTRLRTRWRVHVRSRVVRPQSTMKGMVATTASSSSNAGNARSRASSTKQRSKFGFSSVDRTRVAVSTCPAGAIRQRRVMRPRGGGTSPTRSSIARTATCALPGSAFST
jgi:hypothetical protein